MSKLCSGNAVLVRRNEGWREAVQWLQVRHKQPTAVYLDSGLIETNRMLAEAVKGSHESAAVAQSYLGFPLRGPYSWEPTIAISRNQWDARRQLPLVLRASKLQAEALIRRMGQSEGEVTIETFGNLIVIDRLPSE